MSGEMKVLQEETLAEATFSHQLYEISDTVRNADFYILTKGENSGRVEKEAGANTVGVKVNRKALVPDYLKYVVEHLFTSGLFKSKLKGSAVPYVKVSDINDLIIDFFRKQQR
jgi:hypothetical protein